MRLSRPFLALLVTSLLASVVFTGGSLARAQSSEDAQEEADAAQRRAQAATGLVDEAVANRESIERQLADSIARLNELSAELSRVGADLDRVASQVGFADVELAGIQSDIESQAVDAYMTVVASPSASLVNTSSVEMALVASSVVDDVVADGRFTVGELLTRRESLEDLKETYLADQEEFQALQAEVDAEVDRYASLYEQAEDEVAAAVRDAEAANQAYLGALSAVELARAKEEERRRQEERETTTTTTPGTTTPTTTPGTTSTSSGATTTTSGGDKDWNHPPEVERWRSLVAAYFPSSRIEEALAIIDCESNGDPNAVNPYSGASGLFQFLPSTWESTAAKAGFAGASPFEPEANVGSAAWLGNRYEQLGYYFWHPWNCKRVLD